MLELSIDQISDMFSEEITAAGGVVHERFGDESGLFVRSILPKIVEILPRDGMKGGVAMRADEEQISIYPYTFRLICTNGAIHASTLQSRQIVLSDLFDPSQTESELREAVRASCSQEAFDATTSQMRDASHHHIDFLLNLAPFLSRMSPAQAQFMLDQVSAHRPTRRPATRYDLVNAITATARDTRDPKKKWELEELGGAIAAGKLPPHRPVSARATRSEPVSA